MNYRILERQGRFHIQKEETLTKSILWQGMVSDLILLPVLIYRLIRKKPITSTYTVWIDTADAPFKTLKDTQDRIDLLLTPDKVHVYPITKT